MKALSIRQPWAELILQGKKTLELRTWQVAYRGSLAIHAAQTVEQAACQEFGLDAATLTTGAVVGVVDLVNIVELDEAAFATRQAEHLDRGPFKRPPLFGWELANPRSLPQPRPMPGRMSLFDAPDESELEAESQTPVESSASGWGAATLWDPERPFELRVTPAQAAYGLALYQRPVEPPGRQRTLYDQTPPDMQRVVELGGDGLKSIADHVLEALRRSGYKATDLGPGRREPFLLDEEAGVRLGLLFLAVKPISKLRRVEAIAEGIRAMTSEEAYYWYSKCTTDSARSERAQKALRVLLSEE